MKSLALLAALAFNDVSYGPPQVQRIDIQDPSWFGHLNGTLQYYDDVNHWVRIQCTTVYYQQPPLPPLPIYTTYNFSFSDSAVTSLQVPGNTLFMTTDRGDIVYVSGFEEGQNEE